MRVLQYLKNTPGQVILLRPTSLQLEACCYFDWAGIPMMWQSIIGYMVTLGGSPISWKTKKQTVVSRSSVEAKYRSMAVTTSELIRLKSFLKSLGVDHVRPMRLHCDNQAALHIAVNLVFHERTKYIEINCHFIREHLLAKNIVTEHMSSRRQSTDIFTKALGKTYFGFYSISRTFTIFTL
ncbi:hypothetical protein CRG98_012785 [Punica granatum]|uniref:Uncharacterized protein n=1 Tax=Punica granatum TaxID=22663 RepID=A0A2I0KE40_PUNGR|nr:hypothetical protein CRG98_012785 [Punica granatum]